MRRKVPQKEIILSKRLVHKFYLGPGDELCELAALFFLFSPVPILTVS